MYGRGPTGNDATLPASLHRRGSNKNGRKCDTKRKRNRKIERISEIAMVRRRAGCSFLPPQSFSLKISRAGMAPGLAAGAAANNLSFGRFGAQTTRLKGRTF